LDELLDEGDLALFSLANFFFFFIPLFGIFKILVFGR
jgi:hypothetical protein